MIAEGRGVGVLGGQAQASARRFSAGQAATAGGHGSRVKFDHSTRFDASAPPGFCRPAGCAGGGPLDYEKETVLFVFGGNRPRKETLLVARLTIETGVDFPIGITCGLEAGAPAKTYPPAPWGHRHESPSASTAEAVRLARGAEASPWSVQADPPGRSRGMARWPRS